MPVVNGTLENFGMLSIAALDPEIIFTANKPAVGLDNAIFVTDPIVEIPAADGTWAVLLQNTSTLITADVYYTIVIRWRDPANNYMRADFPDWKLYVPDTGGEFTDLIKHPVNPGLVIVSPVNPGTDFELNTAWLQMDPNDPDNPLNPGNTGDYYELEVV